ncbi:hypothetical protein [Amycolatopsis cihanbeyliensis]|uniref:Glycosyl hydrolase family 43 n=1 Tax=Amycolatopsis cihanbeyliensis TaxID=1128664 RepID=A0A542DCZ7_AMYCI|nr:hypothetical protein [Amycolatopsis cihanbeyliensis]TQJ00943.1 hypothetical protein FB471_0596 [Amycolatopsis cihanbeyliensis]
MSAAANAAPGRLLLEPGSGAATPVHRYWHPGDRDWVSVPAHGSHPTRERLESYGYEPVPEVQFYVDLVGNSELVANYRWWHPADKDWIDVPEGSISDERMREYGYTIKMFQYFVFPVARTGTVAVYRWWNPGDRDWITLRDGEISDDHLESLGYQDRTFLFYAYPYDSPTAEGGYFPLGEPRSTVLEPMPWTGSEDRPHTLSVLDVNPDRTPDLNRGYRYLGYYGHAGCSGIGIARADDPATPSWDQQEEPLFTGHGERWCSALRDGDAIAIVHNVYWCGGSPDGLPYYIVGRKSTDGLHGTRFTEPLPLVKEPHRENGNPTLFRDPADGRVYLYWFRRDGDTFTIRVRGAADLDGLFAADPADIGELVVYSAEVVAAPQVMKVGELYYLVVETYENQNVWMSRVLTSTSPTGGFFEVPANPVYGAGSACVFQHVFGDTMHSYYCHERTPGSENWTLDHVSAPLG